MTTNIVLRTKVTLWPYSTKLLSSTARIRNRDVLSPLPEHAFYSTEDGRTCAVGRCLTDPSGFEKRFPRKSLETIVGSHYISVSDFENLLKDKYRGFPNELWRLIQNLHDVRDNWDAIGLSGLSAHGRRARTDVEEWIQACPDLPMA